MTQATTEDPEVQARRNAGRCVPPLRLLAVAFVMPMVPTCMGTASPLSFGLLDVPAAVETWPLFLFAGVLAVLASLQPVGAPRPAAARAVMVPPVLLWLANAWPLAKSAVRCVEDPPAPPGAFVEVALALVAFPLSIAVYIRAVRASGWVRWRDAIASFAAATWLTFPAQYLVGSFVDARERALLLPGAYVFGLALVWLLTSAAWRRA